MGEHATSSVIFVGLARLPQPCISAEAALAVEVEVELPTSRILAANSTLPLPGMNRLLKEVLVGERLAGARRALLELRVRYSAPFTAALCAAVERALERASSDIHAAPVNGGRTAVPAEA